MIIDPSAAGSPPCSRIATMERSRCWRRPIRPVTPFITMPTRRSFTVLPLFGADTSSSTLVFSGRYARPPRCYSGTQPRRWDGEGMSRSWVSIQVIGVESPAHPVPAELGGTCELVQLSRLQVWRGAGLERVQRGAGLVGQPASALLPAAPPVRELRLDDPNRRRVEVVQRRRPVHFIRITQYGETLQRKVASSHRRRGPRLTFARKRGRLQVRVPVGEVLGRESEYGVARLGQARIRHQREDLEPAAVDE